MQCVNEIHIAGSPDRIFQLASNIQEWPAILPHYRYVVIQEEGNLTRVALMAASRDGFPVKWRARQELVPDTRGIRFVHIGGITRGMDVEWRIEPQPDTVRVTIHHALNYPVPILGPLFAEFVVGRLFVHNIAGKTLKCIKQIVESEVIAGESSSPESAP